MTTTIYRIPVRNTITKNARYKAIIEAYGNYRLIYIKATSHADAYRQLCAVHLPKDDRPIGCKKHICDWTDKRCAAFFNQKSVL